MDEWAETAAGVTHATEFGGKIYIIDASSSLPTIGVTVLNGESTTNHKYQLGVSKDGNLVCDVTGQYFVCAQGKKLTVINLRDGSSRSVNEEGEINTISTSGAGEGYNLRLFDEIRKESTGINELINELFQVKYLQFLLEILAGEIHTSS